MMSYFVCVGGCTVHSMSQTNFKLYCGQCGRPVVVVLPDEQKQRSSRRQSGHKDRDELRPTPAIDTY